MPKIVKIAMAIAFGSAVVFVLTAIPEKGAVKPDAVTTPIPSPSPTKGQ